MKRQSEKPKPKPPYDSIDELIQAMQDAAQWTAPGDDMAATSSEIAERTKLSYGKTIEILKRLKAEGRLENVRVMREQLDGSMRGVPGYRIIRP